MKPTINFVGTTLTAVIACAAIASGGSAARAGWNPFTPGSPVQVGRQSGQMAIADFNGDGRGDILVSYSLAGKASLLLGDGHGAFPADKRSDVNFGFDPAAIAVGDLNGDHRPDVVASSREGEAITVHTLLNANGVLREDKNRQMAAYNASQKAWKPSLTLIDVNGDKHLDLIVADGRRNQVDVFYGSGAGDFSPGQSIVVDPGYNYYSVVVGDLNGDSRLDMVVAADVVEGRANGRLEVFVGDKQGTLVRDSKQSRDAPRGAKVKTLADINGDGRVDIVLTHGNLATVLVQSKEGGWSAYAGAPFEFSHEAFGIASTPAGYENNDVLVVATVDSIDVVFGHEGKYSRACGAPLPAGPGAYQVAAGDLNGDGKTDMVFNSFEGDSLSLLLSNN